jgi:signal transduction histidine kinase
VLFANNQALQLLGLPAKDVIGINTSDIAVRNDLFRFLIDQKGSAPFKIVVDGRENYFIKEVMEVSQEGSSNKVIVLKNITSFKELDVAKTNFIATVSHELKTPLASSDFSLKLIEDERIGKLSSEQKELIQNLKADNQRMLRILSELLNMSQVESGKIQLNIVKADVYQIIESSLAAVSASAKEKEIIIEQDIAADITTINADAEKLVWVLNNFLTNAIKFSPSPDKIKVEIKQTENSVSFAVKDNGPGIEEKYLNRIFDRYFQVPGRSDKKGSGIGLAICKDFIEAMGGKIWVKSQYGEGSIFGFDLPF